MGISPRRITVSTVGVVPMMERLLSEAPVNLFFNDTATTEIYTLSLHDALPICLAPLPVRSRENIAPARWCLNHQQDRKSTGLKSSHLGISHAVFCLK